MKRLRWAIIWTVAMLAVAGSVCHSMDVWGVSPAVKVFRDTPVGEIGDAGLEFAAAGGEYEAIQLVLRPDEDLANVCVSVGALRSDKGRILPQDIKVYEVRYVSVPHTEQKLWPDPLPPHLRPVDLKANENQPFWIKVRVPPYQTPGEYKGTIAVRGDGLALDVPLTLTVYPFTIGQKPSVRTAFGISRGYLAQHHKVTPKLGDSYLYARYYEMLLDHRVSAYKVPFGLMDDRAVEYLQDPRMTSYVIPYSEDRERMIALRQRLRDVGAFQKGFFYPIDEPFTRSKYDTLERMSNWVHSMTGGAPVCSPFFRGPDFDSEKDLFDYAADWLDIWCINTGYYGAKQREKMEARREAGDELWWYVCCGPGAPKANFFVTMNAMRHRMLFWQMYKYEIEGLLYWSTTYWNPKITKDPWEDMATVKDINPKLYGDGSLMYPGLKVGINGPVSSQRLECILDGLEDIEYLVLLERARGREVADRVVARLVTDMTRYSIDAKELTNAREGIAEVLSGAN